MLLTTEKSGDFTAEDRYCDIPVSGIEAEDLLEIARLTLFLEYPFFGKLANSMALVETDKVKTTAVDARGTFYFRRQWVNSWTVVDAVFEMGHEVYHLVQRLWERMPELVIFSIWNRAADNLADTALIDSGLPPSEISKIMVPQEIQDLSHKYDTMPGMYRHLLDQAKDNTDCPGCRKEVRDLLKMQGDQQKAQQKDNKEINGEEADKSNAAGEGKPGKGHDHGSCDGDAPKHTCGNWRECCAGVSTDAANLDPLEEQIWLEKVIAAKIHAEDQGKMPAGLGEYIDALTTSKVHWEDYVKTSANRIFGKGRYTFNRINRRGPGVGLRLPGRELEGRTAVGAIDTSCSMSVDEVQQCLSEFGAILKLCGCDKLWLILHDGKVYFSGWVAEADLTNLKMARGGTSHLEVFQCLDRTHENEEFNLPLHEEIALAVMFTDLGTTFPQRAPKYETIWGVPSNGCPGMKKEVPFGNKVEVEMDE